jgi:ABC-type nitrate/sulfonate/bicarbonate transport system substrate-binding protein
LSFVKYIPIILAVILTVSVVAFAQMSVPASSGPTNVTLRVSYPDSLDESDVTDMYAFQLLAAQGIHVIPTFYDAPPLSYKGLLSGQQDISFGTTSQSFALGPGVNHQQTTCITNYVLAGAFLEVAGQGITSPQQMLGKTTEDFGPGTSTRALNYYWFAKSGVTTNTNAPDPSSVYIKTGGGNVARVHDLEAGTVQAVVVDDFILSDFLDPAVNNTAHGGPFHVLFYAPTDYLSDCYSVRDDWLSNPQNQQVAVKFIEAILTSQRYFTSNTDKLLSFAGQQLPLTNPTEIQFTSTFYPSHFTYWPFGVFNLQGDQSIQNKFDNTNKFFIAAGLITSPISNSTVQPYGVLNKYFEMQALQALGPYAYPKQPWVDSAFTTAVQAWVPSWIGGVSGASTSADISIFQTNIATSVETLPSRFT